MTTFFQCNGCPKAPCSFCNLDPDFVANDKCLDASQPDTIAVWRRLEVER